MISCVLLCASTIYGSIRTTARANKIKRGKKKEGKKEKILYRRRGDVAETRKIATVDPIWSRQFVLKGEKKMVNRAHNRASELWRISREFISAFTALCRVKDYRDDLHRRPAPASRVVLSRGFVLV